MPMMCLCPRLSTRSFLRFSMHFPSVFHSMSSQESVSTFTNPCLTIHALIGLCGLGIYNARVKGALTSCWVTVPTPALCTTCWTRVSRQCQVSYLHSRATATSTLHLVESTTKIEFGETIRYSTMSLTLRLISPQPRGVRQVES